MNWLKKSEEMYENELVTEKLENLWKWIGKKKVNKWMKMSW